MNKFFYFFITTFLIATCFLSIYLGSENFSNINWLMELRLPRVLLAASVGGLLAICGLVLQAIFSNPLCEPYVLGVSSGATLGIVLAEFLGVYYDFAGMSFSGLLGALFFSFILLYWAKSNRISQVQLILVGVMLNFFGSSLVGLIMVLLHPSGIEGVIYWMLGDLSKAEIGSSICAFVVLIASVVFLLKQSKNLDALYLGNEFARGVGINTLKLRTMMVLWSGIVVSISVSLCGMIGFVGLLLPHLIRKKQGILFKNTVYPTAVLGSVFLVFCDLVSRNIYPPKEFPIGVITALVGAPTFLYVLIRKNKT